MEILASDFQDVAPTAETLGTLIAKIGRSPKFQIFTREPADRVIRSRNQSLMDEPDLLRQLLDKTSCESSGRWNISEAYRSLREAQLITVSRRAFARKIGQLFPRQTSKK